MNEPNKLPKLSETKLILGPKHTVFERTAAELAAVFYEAGRSSGMTSKHKNARSWARANFEKFIPKAIELCVSMLSRPDIADLMKQEIYDALMERNNNKEATEYAALTEVNYVGDNPFKKVN
jgi:hypothetical protein